MEILSNCMLVLVIKIIILPNTEVSKISIWSPEPYFSGRHCKSSKESILFCYWNWKWKWNLFTNGTPLESSGACSTCVCEFRIELKFGSVDF